MTRRRLRYAGGVVVLLAVVALAWTGWTAWHVYRDLDGATNAAEALQTSVTAGDQPGSRAALDQLQADSHGARDGTSGPTWSVLSHLPLFGDDARGVRVASGALAGIADQGLAPIIDSATDLQTLAPKSGAVPLDSIAQLQAPLSEARTAFARADAQLSAQDSSGFVLRLRTQYRELQSRISDASKALDAADTAAKLMPGMLGADGPRHYLLVFESNAELRATGGLPGSVALVTADHGAISLTRQVTGSSFGETSQPALPLTEAEKKIYGPQLGTYFLDANFTPDFPRAADLMQAHWEQRFGQDVDGVFFVDPVALSYVLAATGPVDLGNGLQLNAANAVQLLLSDAYQTYQDPAQQDAFFESVAKGVFNQFLAGAGSSTELLKAIARAADEHRVLAHSFHPDEQKELAGHEIAGELVTDPKAPPQVGIYLNDNTGSKMSYYLHTDEQVSAQYCRDDAQSLVGAVNLQSTAPADAGTSLPVTVTGGGQYGIPAGQLLVALRLYAPVGGSISDVQLQQTPVTDLQLDEQDGRQVATTYVLLKPGDRVSLTFDMTTGPQQTGDVHVTMTPGIEPTSTSSVVPSAC